MAATATSLDAQPSITDTRLLAQPGLSSTRAAFTYAVDLWTSRIDATDVRRLTTGDMLPWMFHNLKMGPLIGKRTWGGLVGILSFPVLRDGGTITAPNFAIWTPEEGWVVENVIYRENTADERPNPCGICCVEHDKRSMANIV